MATYKVIQDVEAEDKLIGPLTLRQFIYAAIGAICLYLSYLLATKGAAFMLAVFVPVAAVCAFFAFPWMRDQPTEVWALAKIRFALKPRRRIWDQSGAKELVTVTAPKQVAIEYTNGLSASEVQSRLRALASTIDTRGWAVKNANLTVSALPQPAGSDRLIAPSTTLPKPVEEADVRASDDMLDVANNASAQRLQSMIDQKSKAHRDELMASLQNETPAQSQARPAAKNDYWFLNQPAPSAPIPSNMVTFNTQVVAPGADDDVTGGPTTDEAHLLAELKEREEASQAGAYSGHMHTIQPLSEQTHTPPPGPMTAPLAGPSIPPPAATNMPPAMAPQADQTASAPVTPAGQTAILQLASNDDLDVATIAREAQRTNPQNEVVIKLH